MVVCHEVFGLYPLPFPVFASAALPHLQPTGPVAAASAAAAAGGGGQHHTGAVAGPQQDQATQGQGQGQGVKRGHEEDRHELGGLWVMSHGARCWCNTGEVVLNAAGDKWSCWKQHTVCHRAACCVWAGGVFACVNRTFTPQHTCPGKAFKSQQRTR